MHAKRNARNSNKQSSPESCGAFLSSEGYSARLPGPTHRFVQKHSGHISAHLRRSLVHSMAAPAQWEAPRIVYRNVRGCPDGAPVCSLWAAWVSRSGQTCAPRTSRGRNNAWRWNWSLQHGTRGSSRDTAVSRMSEESYLWIRRVARAVEVHWRCCVAIGGGCWSCPTQAKTPLALNQT